MDSKVGWLIYELLKEIAAKRTSSWSRGDGRAARESCQDSNETNCKQQVKILIEVFAAPGCSKCAQKRQALRAVTEELGADRFDWHDINLLENIERAVELGVMSPLSLAIDAELVFPALPTPERLRAELARRLARPDASSPQ